MRAFDEFFDFIVAGKKFVILPGQNCLKIIVGINLVSQIDEALTAFYNLVEVFFDALQIQAVGVMIIGICFTVALGQTGGDCGRGEKLRVVAMENLYWCQNFSN